MLAKKNRSNTKDVEKVFKVGKFINSPFLTFKYILNTKNSLPKISFIAPKSIAKKAVERNSLRRLGYQALKNHIKQFPAGIVGAFVFRKPTAKVTEIENEIQTILNKLH